MSGPVIGSTIRGFETCSESGLDRRQTEQAATNERVKVIIRRTHVKSRDGCGNCRRRRVKCDELRPECGNCLKLGKRCDASPDTLSMFDQSSLEWPTAMDEDCQRWKASGIPPVALIQQATSPSWHSFPLDTLRYMHYGAILASFLDKENGNLKLNWWGEYKSWIKLAAEFDFVGHAIAASAADRLAWLLKSSAAHVDACRYQSLAIEGVHQALANFSKQNSDAVLCASILLCMQHRNWRTWKTLIKGTQIVTSSMRSWARDSAFSKYLGIPNEQPDDEHSENTLAAARKAKWTTSFESLVFQGTMSLDHLLHILKGRPELTSMARDLGDILRQVRHSRGDMSEDQIFRYIHPYRSLISSFATSLHDATNDVLQLLVIAHSFAVFLALALIFPSINLDFLVNVRLESLITIEKALQRANLIKCDCCNVLYSTQALMEFPHQVVNQYRSAFRG